MQFQSLNQIRSILDLIPDAIFICDTVGIVHIVNQEAIHLFGYQSHDLIGQSIEILIPIPLREKYIEYRQQYIQAQHVKHIKNIAGLHKNGYEIELDIKLNPFSVIEEGQYISVTARDISYIKEMQMALKQQSKNADFINEKLTTALDNLNETLAELDEKNKQLKKINNEKNQFLGIAAHDLRNPLNAILGYSKLLLSPTFGGLSEEHQYLIQRIERSSDFMLELVNDLLDITAIESGQVQLKKEVTDLERLIEDVIVLERVIADQKHISIKFLCPEILPKVRVDPNKIEQVIHNLLSNACKFSESGTIIKVKTHRKDQHLVIQVEDEGQGISENELEHLFFPFSKTSTLATGGEKSTGLGLAIVKRIIESHEGTIHVESQPGIGSTFTVNLPL